MGKEDAEWSSNEQQKCLFIPICTTLSLDLTQAQLAAKSINVTKKLIRVTEGRQNNHCLAIAKRDWINYPELVLLHAQVIPLLA